MNQGTRPKYDSYEDILRRHHEENYDPGLYPFERYGIAYRHGFIWATSHPTPERNWLEIEDQVRREWEEKNAGPWEDFKGAIQHAWETAQEAMTED